jgi:hypothetical protein
LTNKNIGKIEKKLNRTLFSLFLVLTAFSIIFFFYIRDISHPPDYGYHSVMAILFRENPFSIFIFNMGRLVDICDNFEIARISPVITTPNLYANITGKLLLLTGFFVSNEALSLRIVELLQVSFGLFNIYYIYKTSGFVFKKRFPRIITILLVSNIQMFSYLMSHLNYDQLVNLASTLSIYYLLSYIKERNIKDILKLIIWICIGSLTKFTYGPLLVLLLLILTFNERGRFRDMFLDTKEFVLKRKNLVLTLITSCFFLLTAIFYGNNIINYKTILPSRSQAQLENAYCENRNSEYSAQEYLDSLERPDVDVESQLERVNVFKYFAIWSNLMVERLINIASHKSLYKPRIYTEIFKILLLLSGSLFLVKYRFKEKYINILLFLFWGYIGYLFLYRYNNYLASGNFDRAIAGRYIFPVIAPFIILLVYSFWKILKKKTLPIISLLVLSLFFIYSDKVFLLKNYKVWSVANTEETSETVGPIFLGQSSPKQKFQIGEEYSNNELGVYVSTYAKNIKGGYTLNLYEEDCLTNIESVEMKKIRDNSYVLVKFQKELEYNYPYCFDVENKANDLPVTLWYSLYDIEGSVVSVLLEEKGSTSDLTGPLYEGNVSPRQIFSIDEGYSNDELAIFASTYTNKIEGGFRFNLYDETCIQKVDTLEIERIWDNDYFIVNMNKPLEYSKNYCFEVENIGSQLPITLWYSSLNLNGHIQESEDIDLHYSQVKRFEDEKDILYSPIRKYGF